MIDPKEGNPDYVQMLRGVRDRWERMIRDLAILREDGSIREEMTICELVDRLKMGVELMDRDLARFK